MNTNTSGVIKSNSLATARRQSGFTLIELVIVLAVLGALAAIAVPQLTGLQEDAELAGTATTVSSEAGNLFAKDLLDNNTANWSGGPTAICDGSGSATTVSALSGSGYSLTGSEPSSGNYQEVTIPSYNSSSEQVSSVKCYLTN